MTRLAVIEIHKEENEFSAGHFTIFSATEREDMHGHNYSVSVVIQTALHDDEGLTFDYRVYKKRCQAICQMLDRHFLLPAKSKYLTLEDSGNMWIAHFNHERMPFLKRDVVVLPICNITLEELSNWFLEQLSTDKVEMAKHRIQEMTVKVFNGSSSCGSSGEILYP